MKRIAQTLVIAGLALAAGCGLIRGDSWDPFASVQERQLHIRVHNTTHTDVVVEALAGTRRTELGIVDAGRQTQFRMGWSRVQDLRFNVSLIGGRRHITSGVAVGPGDVVELIVLSPLDRSYVRR